MPSPTDATPAPAPEGLSLIDALHAVLRFRRSIVGIAMTVALLMALFVLTRPRTFASQASFTPQATRSPLGALGGLAAQFGVAMPTGEGNQSPAFYADLLHSRAVLEPLAGLRVPHPTTGAMTTVADLLLPSKLAPELRPGAAVLALRKAMAVAVDARTGVVRITTTTRYAALSATLTDSALAQLNNFNVESRRSQAAAQRSFLEERLATTSRELREAEEALSDFAKRNRGNRAGSPELALQEQRLNRTLSLRTEVQGSLAQALEQAKLDEIRDTPLITVIERARVAVEPQPRGLVTGTVIAFLVGLALGAVVAIVRHALSANLRESPGSFTGITQEWQATRADLRRLLGRRA